MFMSFTSAALRAQMATPSMLLLALVVASGSASDTSTPVEKLEVIDMSSAPAAPPESVEARIALRQHREATVLNRFTFTGNVLEGKGDLVDHWIVMFCPGWHDKCQSLLPSYEMLGVQWENKLNKGLMRSAVRFVKVDCATEKALCVSLDIDDYPSVVHYHKQERVASWHGGAPGLVRFVKQSLEGTKKRANKRQPAAQMKVCTEADAPPAVSETASIEDNGRRVLRSIVLLIVVVAFTRCIFMHFAPILRRTRSVSQPAKIAEEHSRKAAGAGQASSLQRSLPQEWGRERAAIVL